MHFVFGFSMKNIILHYFIHETWTPKLYIAVSVSSDLLKCIHQCVFIYRCKKPPNTTSNIYRKYLHNISLEMLYRGPERGINSGLTFHKSMVKLKKARKSPFQETFIFGICLLELCGDTSSNFRR